MAIKLRNILLGLLITGMLSWWLIGPDWRAFLVSLPSGNDLLFWSQEQRNAGFRMLDRVSFLVKSRPIKSGDVVRKLPVGKDLPATLDIATYMKENNVSGLVILQNGKIRLEKYGLEFNEQGRWTSFSVAKSLTSTLVGAAIKDGYIENLDANVADYIQGLKGSAYDGVTIEQLLTMTSGVKWNEDYSDPNSDVARFNVDPPENGFGQLVSYMRKLPRAHPAGKVWHYSTGETNMIGVLVASATGKNLADYASEKIWQPYGMQADASWLLDEQGEEISGCCIQASTRDFARLGQFILDGATVKGQLIVPNDWVEKATKAQVEFDSLGRGRGYGYQWWTYEGNTFGARGIFGQGIFIDPKRNLVIATNSSWADALGKKQGQYKRHIAFRKAVLDLLDSERQ